MSNRTRHSMVMSNIMGAVSGFTITMGAHPTGRPCGLFHKGGVVTAAVICKGAKSLQSDMDSGIEFNCTPRNASLPADSNLGRKYATVFCDMSVQISVESVKSNRIGATVAPNIPVAATIGDGHIT